MRRAASLGRWEFRRQCARHALADGHAIALRFQCAARPGVDRHRAESDFWDNGVTTNWTNGSPEKFYANDLVTFNDTASNFTVHVQGASVGPGSVLFDNSANNYTFQGGPSPGPRR